MASMAANRKLNILLFLACIFLLGFRIFSLWNSFLPDFHVFYFSSLDLLGNRNPYTDTFLFTGLGYPIVTLLPFLFLTLFPFSIASKIFLILNIVSLCGVITLSLKILQEFSTRNFLVFLFISLFFFPVSFTFGMGQVNILAYFLLLLGIYLRKRFDFYPGILIAFAILLKPIFIFLMLFFLLKKNWKVLFVTLATLIILVLVTIKLFGIFDYFYYLNHQVPQLLSMSGREIYYNQGFTGFIARLTHNLFLRKFIPFLFTIITIFYLLFLWIKKIFYEHLLSLFLIALLLIDTLSWQHHFVFLIFPFITLFFTIKRHQEKSILYFFLGIAFILTGMNITMPNLFMRFPITLLLSHVFYGTILLFALFTYVLQKQKFLQNKKISLLFFNIFILGVLIEYLVFLSCRGHICLR